MREHGTPKSFREHGDSLVMAFEICPPLQGSHWLVCIPSCFSFLWWELVIAMRKVLIVQNCLYKSHILMTARKVCYLISSN